MKNFLLIILFGFSIISCVPTSKKNHEVDFKESDSSQQLNDHDKSKTVYIAIASMTSPKETYQYYSDLINFISKKVDHPIYIKQKKTYEEVNKMLEKSEIDFAFICSGAYTSAYKTHKLRLLVAPQINNKLHYHAYIIVNKNSGITSFKELKDKSFVFTDPLSNTGKLYPKKRLIEMNTTPQEFFMKTVYSYGHDISIQMVNRGIIDGASVHSLIYNYIAYYHPEEVSNINIIEESEEFGMPPIVVPTSLPEGKFRKYQEVFLNMHKDSIGMEILSKLHIDSFRIVDNSIYSSVFTQMKEINEGIEKK